MKNNPNFSPTLQPILLAAILACPAVLQAGSRIEEASASLDAPPPVSRSAYQVLRFYEDWTVIENPGVTPHRFYDPIKHITLGSGSESYLSFGGQMRQRIEVWENFGFAAANDDAFLLSRYQIHADLHLNQHLRFFAEGIHAHTPDSRDLPGGNRAIDTDEFDLLNAFMDIHFDPGGVPITFRAGRQQFSFGKQRLVSPLPWVNSYRTWDGFRADIKLGDWTLTPFHAWFVPVRKYDFNEVTGSGKTGNGANRLWGLYTSNPAVADFYYIGHSPNDNNTSHTFGARRGASIGTTGFDYEFEAALQAVDQPAGDHLTYLLGGELRWAPHDVPGQPRLHTGIEVGGARLDQVFPLGHAYYGQMDNFGRANAIDWHNGFTLSPFPTLKGNASHHLFFREATGSGLTTVGGTPFRGGAMGRGASFIGSEIDLTLTWSPAPEASFQVGYSHFFTGNFIDQTGPAHDAKFFYAQWLVQF